MIVPTQRLSVFLLLATVLLALAACQPEVKTFPVLGPKSPKPGGGDTVLHRIGDFTFIDQTGDTITEADVAGKMYLADFFFTRCPDICPIMNRQMMRVHEQFKDDPRLLILSHSLDPEFDTVEVLAKHGAGLNADPAQWHLLTTPDEDYVYEIMMDDYLLSGSPEGAVTGGIFHSGKIVLIDDQRRIRGYYEGTEAEDVDRLIEDLPLILNTLDTSGS